MSCTQCSLRWMASSVTVIAIACQFFAFLQKAFRLSFPCANGTRASTIRRLCACCVMESDCVPNYAIRSIFFFFFCSSIFNGPQSTLIVPFRPWPYSHSHSAHIVSGDPNWLASPFTVRWFSSSFKPTIQVCFDSRPLPMCSAHSSKCFYLVYDIFSIIASNKITWREKGEHTHTTAWRSGDWVTRVHRSALLSSSYTIRTPPDICVSRATMPFPLSMIKIELKRTASSIVRHTLSGHRGNEYDTLNRNRSFSGIASPTQPKTIVEKGKEM